jgi:uncharacterized protein YjiS (DUF1127 family)
MPRNGFVAAREGRAPESWMVGVGRRRRWILTIALWIERHRSRRALAALDAHLLDDIGVSRADAQRESARPFWMTGDGRREAGTRARTHFLPCG